MHGADAATDGDFDIADGLLPAHAQWGSGGAVDYLGAARRVLAGALAEDVHPRTHLTTLGDWTGPGSKWRGARPSDWTPGHFRAFAAATGDGAGSACGRGRSG